MATSHNKARLPANPTLKEINWYKKQLNWGELPPFYHMVSQSLSESENLLEHGFDTAIKRLLDKRNWNLKTLGGQEDHNGIIHCDNKPRIGLHQSFTERGFELSAYAYAGDEKIRHYVRDNAKMEFDVWDPATMEHVIRIGQLHKFIAFFFDNGDDADKALIIHAHKVVHDTVELLRRELNVQAYNGVSIKEFYKMCEKHHNAGGSEFALARLMEPDDYNHKE
ncbi:hypothetical protein FIU82_16130 (plasmid) [Pseudoalteromonas sp. THAF3]|uniref:hypothetical protein n=1 Tax=Pseudoalteromonas sp. THAF3 TaxID=2587843 RepID=UPI001267C8DB|nr:hypothetical protein [Pseudoalteromonas sp. THAF3]QFU06517.1 hypothetical protein FIU82_16130 [Pseudoalteromonas sp. THAF3]